MPNFPVHEELEVLDGHTVYKSDDWWKAVVLYEGFRDRPEIGLYLWKMQDDEWRRQQKYVIRSREDWEGDKEALEQFVSELEEE